MIYSGDEQGCGGQPAAGVSICIAINCETIFVDHRIAKLDNETEKMVQAYPRILYISCNPETLCRNLETLSQTHNVTRLALFDQFPYTHHMECGVLLTRK
ncbi:hypothetical protein MJ579_01255 [Klebsiella pneumoniae]|nr:hypothetical protein MJ579_01255 [Klebsiella pneumoniae]